MEKLKFIYLRIEFIDGESTVFFNSNIDHIESYANSTEGFVVKVYYKDKSCKSHIETCIYDMKTIKSINQRWERVGDENEEK